MNTPYPSVTSSIHIPRKTDKAILLLDMDGPLVDFDRAVWDFIHLMGFTVDLEDLSDPRRQRFMTANMPFESERKHLRQTIDNTRWFLNLPITPGALKGVRELEDVFDIWVCTKPLEANRRCRDDKAAWLRNFFPHLEPKMIIAPTKSFVHGDILLDDAPSTDCIELATWNPVLFPDTFNTQPGCGWEDLPRWKWGDDPADLYQHIATPRQWEVFNSKFNQPEVAS